MKFRLKSLFLIAAFAAIGLALLLSRRELAGNIRLYQDSVHTGIRNGYVSLSQINGESFLARVGNDSELRFRIATSQSVSGERSVIEEFQLGPGLYTVCLVHDKSSGLFGRCVNRNLHVHSTPAALGTAAMGGFGAKSPPDWSSVWSVSNSVGNETWRVELQQFVKE